MNVAKKKVCLCVSYKCQQLRRLVLTNLMVSEFTTMLCECTISVLFHPEQLFVTQHDSNMAL